MEHLKAETADRITPDTKLAQAIIEQFEYLLRQDYPATLTTLFGPERAHPRHFHEQLAMAVVAMSLRLEYLTHLTNASSTFMDGETSEGEPAPDRDEASKLALQAFWDTPDGDVVSHDLVNLGALLQAAWDIAHAQESYPKVAAEAVRLYRVAHIPPELSHAMAERDTHANPFAWDEIRPAHTARLSQRRKDRILPDRSDTAPIVIADAEAPPDSPFVSQARQLLSAWKDPLPNAPGGA
jgi:hypothetical protein